MRKKKQQPEKKIKVKMEKNGIVLDGSPPNLVARKTYRRREKPSIEPIGKSLHLLGEDETFRLA